MSRKELARIQRAIGGAGSMLADVQCELADVIGPRPECIAMAIALIQNACSIAYQAEQEISSARRSQK